MPDSPSTSAHPVDASGPLQRFPLLSAIAVTALLLASYAVFRALANAHAIAAHSAAIIDAIWFGLADGSVIVWTYRAARSVHDDPATRRAWLSIMAASAFNACGSTFATMNEIRHPGTMLPFAYNIVFALGYVLTIAGMLSFPMAPRRRADRITLSFDIATVALSGIMVLWYWCVRAGAFESSTAFTSKAIVIGFPAADIAVLVTAAILLVRSADDRSRTVFAFFGIAYLLSAVGDFWYGYLDIEVVKYQRSTILDVCWFGGVLLLTFAADFQLRHPRAAEAPRRIAVRWMAEIPTIAVALAFAMLFFAIAENRESVEVQLGAGAMVMTVLAIGRQRISARDAALLMNERASRDARFRALIQNSSDVVLVLDGALRTTYVSPSIAGVLGFDSDGSSGEPFIDWVEDDDRKEAATMLGRVAQLPFATESARFRMVHADGGSRTMETLASNLLDDPAVRGIVLNCRDITQRLALEEQLQHTQKLEVVGRLAGGVAHDFNNLLMVIGANAEFVLSSDGDVPARREAAEEIKSTTKRAAALTKQLLAFSRRQDARPALVDPNDIVRHVEHMLVRLMQHTTRLQTDLTDEPVAVEIDPGQLEQALLNLAVNARDAMPAGGDLCIRTRNARISERVAVERGVLPPGDYVLISVEDDGAGMSEDVRKRIFEPFFTTKPIGSGTGLGLAMVLNVVQQAGGHIQVKSELGAGTKITLYLPAASRSAETVERPNRAVLRGSGRILIVDDEEGVRTVLQRLLRRMGYEVDAVGDATTALAMLAVKPLRFDLVLSDILMPEKNGLELASEIIEGGIPVAVVLMTGFADSALVREATHTRGLRVLRKPFEVDQLAAILEEALSRAFAARAGD